MPSPSDPNAARRLANGLGDYALNQDGTGGSVANLMSPRQHELNRLWKYYRAQFYEGRKCDWDGREIVSPDEHDAIAMSGQMPGAFYDAGTSYPVKFRKPYAPLPLARLVVKRMTAMLFGQNRCPAVTVIGDPDSEDWLTAAIEQAEFWPRMARARTFGGAVGSCAASFKFVEGELQVEAHDPRWCTPTWRNRATFDMSSMEIRFWFVEQEKDEDGNWVDALYWYRRVIGATTDTVWPKVSVGDGKEPAWAREAFQVETHGFKFCPVEWAQNSPVDDSIDGDPDCHGAYDLIETIDTLRSAAQRGITGNCDPTLSLNTDANLEGIRKGNDNAIKLEKGASSSYLEITGAGPKAALEMAEIEERRFQRVTRCCIDTGTENGPAKTATEVDQAASAMNEHAGELRDVYGPFAKRLLTKIERAARALSTARADTSTGTPRIVRNTFRLPPRVVTDAITGLTTTQERKLGPGGAIGLRWPPLVQPSVADALVATQAASGAKAAGLIDDEHATRYVSHFYGVEDVAAVVRKAKVAQKEMADSLSQGSVDTLHKPPTREGFVGGAMGRKV